MPPDPDGPGSPAHWLRHARSDLAYATATVPPGGLLEVPCFHAQQAAEKAIKAVLVAAQLPIPRTHNLKTLLERLPASVDVPEEVEGAAILTDYAVETRYPSDIEPVTEEECRDAVENAQRVVKWAEGMVRRLSQGDEDANSG